MSITVGGKAGVRISNGVVVGPSVGVRLVGGGGIEWLLRDDFVTAEAAPLASPRTAEPGPGTLTITDTNEVLTIADGKLKFATGGASFGDPGIWSEAMARAIGRAVIAGSLQSSAGHDYLVGWDSNQLTTPTLYAIYAHPTSGLIAFISSGSLVVGGITNGAAYKAAVVLRSTGAFLLVKGGTEYLDWTVAWVDATLNTATVYATLTGSTTTAFTADNFRVLDLPAPFDTDYGLATQRLAGSVAAGTTFTHEANCVIEWTQTTKPSSGPSVVVFRRQDATNYWYVYVTSDGSLGLYEGVAGVETQRAVNSAGVSNGHRIVIVADGTTIRVYSNNVLRFTYSSASNFATATSGKLSTIGTGGAVSDVISWPRELSGAAANALDAAIA